MVKLPTERAAATKSGMDTRWRKLERDPLHAGPCDAQIEREAIHRVLPHRATMLLIDRILGVDLGQATISGEYDVRADDPIFEGHFPNQPIFPGVLQAEAVGQLGLCMAWFAEHGRTTVTGDGIPLRARVTRIHHARFFRPVVPGDTLEVHAALLERDAFAGTAAGQIYVDGSLRSVAAFEVYFDA